MAQGSIKTPNPQGRAFPFPWGNVTRWEPQAKQASVEFGVPVERLLAHVAIESGGEPKAYQKNPTNGDSLGLMQIVVFGGGWNGWWKRFKDLSGSTTGFDPYDPLLNVRVGASILRDFWRRHGSWDAASSSFFTGKPGWVGADSINGTQGGDYKRCLDGLIEELGAGSPPVPATTTTTTAAPAPLAFGRVPYPAVTDRIIQDNTAWDDLGPRLNRGVVLHRMLGTLWGTDGYFRGEARGRALTDYGVDNQTGETLCWNDPWGRRAPWASGPVSKPYGDGKALVDTYGVNAVNRDLRSVEIAGQYGDPVSAAAWLQVAKLVAYWADRAKVPWRQFPINPATGISFVFWHQEFTIGTGKVCPGDVVMGGTPALIETVKGILRGAQEGSGTPPPAPPPDPVVVNGLTRSQVAKIFPDYSEGQPISDLWLNYCKQSGRTPRLATRWAGGDGWVKAWEFADGWFAFSDGKGKVWGSDDL